jgi:hypothetical protein
VFPLQRGHRSLLQNIDSASAQGTTNGHLEGSSLQGGASPLAESAPPDEAPAEDDDFEVPDVIEDVIEHLLTGLKDKVR